MRALAVSRGPFVPERPGWLISLYQAVETVLIERIRGMDFKEAGRPDASAQRLRRSFRPDFRASRPFRAHVSHGSCMMRAPPAAQATHAYQVEGGKAQQRLAGELGLTDQPGLGQSDAVGRSWRAPRHCIQFSFSCSRTHGSSRDLVACCEFDQPRAFV